MKYFSLVIIAISMFMAGCEDPAANKPRATVAESSNNPVNTASNQTDANSIAAPVVKGIAYAITPENSKVEFVGSKVTGKHDGGFKQFSGIIDVVVNKAEESSVFVEIDMTSVFSDDDGLTEHLKSADFFDVEKFPKSSFRSTKFVVDTAKGGGYVTLTGDLSLHGVTKSITFPAKVNIGEDEVSVNSEFSINRRDFNINYAGMANDLIRDDVVIKLDLKSPRKK